MKTVINKGPLRDSEVPKTLGFTLEMFHTDQFDEKISTDKEPFSTLKNPIENPPYIFSL